MHILREAELSVWPLCEEGKIGDKFLIIAIIIAIKMIRRYITFPALRSLFKACKTLLDYCLNLSKR